MNNAWLFNIKLIVVDIILDFFYWPIWWYTVGLKNALLFCGRQIRQTWRALALGIWLRNMLTPMYGDRSILGRAISLMMRIVVLAWKMTWMILWLMIILMLLALWVGAPFFVIWMIGEHEKILF